MSADGYFRKRLDIIRAPGSSREARFFALLEISCFSASAATLAVVLPLQLFLPEVMPEWAVTVLLSGAVGFLTNYLAIEMLFKPYRVSRLHPLTLLSCGYWKLGLIPRGKDEIGRELGRQVEEKLLDPDRIAAELCSLAADFIASPEFFAALRARVVESTRGDGGDIAAALHPGINAAVAAAVAGAVTRENLIALYRREIAPLLLAPSTRAEAAAMIVAALKKRAPELALTLRDEVRSGTRDYLARRLPGGIGAETIADGVSSRIDRIALEARINERLDDADTAALLDRELAGIVRQLELRLTAPEAAARLDVFAEAGRVRLETFLSEYLQKMLPELIRSFAASDAMWERIRRDVLPAAAPELERLLDSHARSAIVTRLDIAGRISTAVSAQDVGEFHRMIDGISARHLAAIQALGYFLGALIGGVQALLNFCR